LLPELKNTLLSFVIYIEEPECFIPGVENLRELHKLEGEKAGVLMNGAEAALQLFEKEIEDPHVSSHAAAGSCHIFSPGKASGRPYQFPSTAKGGI